MIEPPESISTRNDSHSAAIRPFPCRIYANYNRLSSLQLNPRCLEFFLTYLDRSSPSIVHMLWRRTSESKRQVSK